MMAETQRVSGRMRSSRTDALRSYNRFPILSMVPTPFVAMLMLHTRMPFTLSSCTFMPFLSIKETWSYREASLLDNLIVARKGLQSIRVNTDIVNLKNDLAGQSVAQW